MFQRACSKRFYWENLASCGLALSTACGLVLRSGGRSVRTLVAGRGESAREARRAEGSTASHNGACAPSTPPRPAAQFSRHTPQRPLHAGRAATLPVSRWNLRGSPPLNMLVRARACTDHPFDRPWPAHPTTRARCLAPYNFEGTWHFDLEWGCDVLWCLFPAGVRCVQRTGVQERAGSRRPAADIALNFAGRCDLAAHHAGAAAGDRI